MEDNTKLYTIEIEEERYNLVRKLDFNEKSD